MSANGSFFRASRCHVSGEWVKEHIGKYAPGMDWDGSRSPRSPAGSGISPLSGAECS